MKKNTVKNKVPKYEFGTLIENPATTLYENQIAMANASKKAGNNSWVKGLKIFGNLAQQVGTSMMNSKGAGSTTPGGDAASTEGFGGAMNSFFGENKDDVQSGVNLMGAFSQFMAMGGTVKPGVPVEVEGEEVGETPSGQLLDFKGPSHESGGIPTVLPAGTEMYSKRIKVDGVSMADRKKKRERKTVTLESLFKTNDTDALIRNSLTRTKQNNEMEENADNQIQQVVKQLLEKKGNKHAFGNTVGEDENNPFAQLMKMFSNNGMLTDNEYGGFGSKTPSMATTPINSGAGDYLKGTVDANPGTSTGGNTGGSMFGDITFGDAIGLAGNMVSTFGPMKNTQANRAGDTPNINAFKDFGKDGLEKMDESKKYINQVREQKLKDLELARTGTVKRNNNSARSVNVNRALNLATDAGINDAQEQTYNSFAESMMAILGQEANMENQQDHMVMSGEQARDLADRQDRDNYFTQMAQDIATKGKGLQETGYDVNKIKERQVMQNLLNQLSAYGITIDKEGNISNPKKN